MNGVVIVNGVAGRALRKACAALRVADVLGCSGDFRCGDSVYVTMRARDGGQNVIASGVVQLDAAVLLQLKAQAADAPELAVDRTEPVVVVHMQDLTLLW